MHLELGQSTVDLFHVFRSQYKFGGFDVLLKVLDLARSGDRDDERPLGQQPCERQLRRRSVFSLRESGSGPDCVPSTRNCQWRSRRCGDTWDSESAPVGTRGMVVGEATVELLTPCSLVRLLDTPQDVPFFGKLLQREIIYRLLQGPQGDRLRSVATLADQSYRTAKAVTWLRENFKKTLNVDELASMAGMSRSTLHHHFRGLTAMSPLQFQKQLRLHTARQKMLTEELDAASAAFEVGYESPSQFNREYKRFFGKPPMRDVQTLRASL